MLLPHLADKLLWIDIETTGLNPYSDQILEVGLAVTNTSLELQRQESWIVSLDSIDRSWEPVVLEMHSKSGLLVECLTEGHPLWAVLRDAYDFIGEEFFDAEVHPEPVLLNDLPMTERPRLCGSSVHFDHAFLDRACTLSLTQVTHLPDKLLHYRHIDVSTLGGLFELYRPDIFEARPSDRKTHRVLEDIGDSIEQFRYYMNNMYLLPIFASHV